MISDQEALSIMGEILAGFLKENLPPENRWEKHVAPALRTQPDTVERPLEQLDLSSLLQVFMGNKSYFFDSRIFRTGLPFQLALCVRAMRNSRAHLSYASALTEDECLFDLHALRRFTMLIDNRAVTPGLTEQFLSALDERILDATHRCLDMEHYKDAEPSDETQDDIPVSELLKLTAQTQQDLASMHDQVKNVATHLDQITPSAGLPSASTTDQTTSGKAIEERLSNIEFKLDKLLANGSIDEEEPIGLNETGLPENLSYLETKAALRSLRSRLADTYPEIEPVRQLLRQSMVDLLLDHRITDLPTYEEKIPDVMRRDTDQRQLEALPQVFDIVKRLRLGPNREAQEIATV